jgi:hypothetical protein
MLAKVAAGVGGGRRLPHREYQQDGDEHAQRNLTHAALLHGFSSGRGDTKSMARRRPQYVPAVVMLGAQAPDTFAPLYGSGMCSEPVAVRSAAEDAARLCKLRADAGGQTLWKTNTKMWLMPG